MTIILVQCSSKCPSKNISPLPMSRNDRLDDIQMNSIKATILTMTDTPNLSTNNLKLIFKDITRNLTNYLWIKSFSEVVPININVILTLHFQYKNIISVAYGTHAVFVTYIVMFECCKHLEFPVHPLTRDKILEDIWHFLEGHSLSIPRICDWPAIEKYCSISTLLFCIQSVI